MTDHSENIINAEYWESAAKRYQLLRSPLIPTEPDLQFVRQIAEQFNRPLKILQLGVTPALVSNDWPKNSHLLSLDHSKEMIEHIWPGPDNSSGIKREALLQDWLSIGKNGADIDLVVGDGAFNNISTFTDLPTVLHNLRQVLKPGGLLAQRIFVTPEEQPSPDDLVEDLKQDRVENFHAFKWRLVMSLQKHAGGGVTLNDVWEFWNQAVPQPENLYHSTRWSPDVYKTIAMYRGQDTRFFFPTLEQIIDIISSNFSLKERFIPDYDLGDRCPTLIFSKGSCTAN